jgi:hypothetical protein
VKTSDTTRHRAIIWCLWLWTTLGIRLALGGLILDDPDVSGGRSREYILFGGLRQVLELALLPSSPQGTTPRCWYIPLSHKPSAYDVVGQLR